MTAPRVLVVDDNALNLEVVECLLRSEGFDVDVALDAGQARAALQRRLPDLILMDMQMPDVDGLAMTREIKADPAWRHLPVVAFTAYAMQGDEARFLACGCDGYLSKPIDVATFGAQVRAVLARR